MGLGCGEEPDIMTWFPRREDYEELPPAIVCDESLEEKIGRLNETIETNQTNIKEVVDGDSVCLEHKIYRTMDLHQDLADLQNLLRECEGEKESDKYHEGIKKAKVGLINLKAYLDQVDVLEFASAILNEFQFNVGCHQRFGPWLDKAETNMTTDIEKPTSFEHAQLVEQKACLFLKDVVKANKSLKTVQVACEGIKGNMEAHEAMAKLGERYYVLCKKAEQRMKNLQHLMIEWKRLDDLLEETDPQKVDDIIPKQMIIFLKTYALYFG